MSENKKEPDQVWWHIMSNDGKYLSRSRFGTRESAIQEMTDAPKTYPAKQFHAVKVEYRFAEESAACAQDEETPGS